MTYTEYTPEQYEQALVAAGFRRSLIPGHVVTTLKNGHIAHFCEAASQDDFGFGSYRSILADLCGQRAFENEQNEKPGKCTGIHGHGTG